MIDLLFMRIAKGIMTHPETICSSNSTHLRNIKTISKSFDLEMNGLSIRLDETTCLDRGFKQSASTVVNIVGIPYPYRWRIIIECDSLIWLFAIYGMEAKECEATIRIDHGISENEFKKEIAMLGISF